MHCLYICFKRCLAKRRHCEQIRQREITSFSTSREMTARHHPRKSVSEHNLQLQKLDIILKNAPPQMMPDGHSKACHCVFVDLPPLLKCTLIILWHAGSVSDALIYIFLDSKTRDIAISILICKRRTLEKIPSTTTLESGTAKENNHTRSLNNTTDKNGIFVKSTIAEPVQLLSMAPINMLDHQYHDMKPQPLTISPTQCATSEITQSMYGNACDRIRKYYPN